MPDEGLVFQVDKWCDKALGFGREVFLGTALGMMGVAKEATPVRTGNLRAAWQIARDGEQAEIVGREGPNPADVPAIAQAAGMVEIDPGLAALKDVQLGERLVIFNPTSYALSIDQGREIQRQDGTVTHVAGRHMVAQAIAAGPRIAEEVVRRIQSRPDAGT